MAATFIILIISFMFYTEVLNDPCPSTQDIVPVCTNSTLNYQHLNITVDDSVGNGCICDIKLVNANSSTGAVEVHNIEGEKGCGYKVVNYNTSDNNSWTCLNNEKNTYPLSLNESFPLTFSRDSSPDKISTGFCLHLTTTVKGVVQDIGFTITCKRNHTTPNTPSPVSTSTDELSEAVIIGGAAGGACLLLILVVVVTACLVKRRKIKTHDKPSPKQTRETCYEDIRHDQPTNMDNDLHVSTGITISGDGDSKGNKPPTDMIYLENDLYVSYDSVTTTANFPPSRQGDGSVHSVPNNSSPTKRSPGSLGYTDIDDFPGQKQDKSQEQSTNNTTTAFIVGKNQNVKNVYAVVNKKPKSGQTGVSFDDSQNQNSGNPAQSFSVAQSPNPNNVYAVVNKKPKVVDITSKPTKPSKPAKTVKPPVAPKPKI